MKEKKKKSLKFKISIVFIIIAAVCGGAYGFYYFTNPQITLNGEKNMEVTMADGYDEPGAEASFAFHDISSHVEVDSKVDDGKVGTYQVIYKVTYLEKTATAERTVNVVDREPPDISLTGGDKISIRPAEKFKDPGAEAIDDSDGDVTDQISSKGFVDVYNKGDYEITYTVSDSYGNEAVAVRTVTVEGEPVKKMKGVIYLTFDDGPSEKVTPRILKTLEKYEVPATFFVLDYGDDKKKIKLMKRALKDGCAIGIHGYSHDYSRIYTSVDAFMGNVTSLHDKLLDDIGYDAFTMRFPGGSSNTISRNYSEGIMTKLVKEIQKEGYSYNDWNVDSTDASGNNRPAKTLVESVKKNCSKDTYNVVLMHDSDAKETTAKALPEIIEWGLEEGYKFKAITPNSPTIHHPVNN